MLRSIAVTALLIFPLTSCMSMDEVGASGAIRVDTTSIKTEPVRAVCDVTPTGEAAVAPARMWSGHAWITVSKIETPRTLWLDDKAESYEIVCEAEGYYKATATVKRRLSPAILLNAVFLLGMPYAVAIDLATGEAWRYPFSVTIELEPTEAVTD